MSSSILKTETPPASKLALRAREAAEMLSVSERTVCQWTSEGWIPHIQRGNVTLYPVDALRDWLKAQASPPSPGKPGAE